MTRMRQVGLSLAVVCAISAIAVPAASAEAPEYGRCVKVAKGTGTFETGTCTKLKTNGNFEWMPGVPEGQEKFTTTGGESKLEAVTGGHMKCTGESGSGEFKGTKETRHVTMTFTGCEAASMKCASAGAGAGEVVVNGLQGTLRWEHKALKKVALDLEAESGELYPHFLCGQLEGRVRGSILVNAKAGKMETTFTQKYAGKGGLQKPEAYETAEGAKVFDFPELSVIGLTPFQQSALEVTVKQKNETAVEVNWFV
jgi:hypothetical protein